MKKILMLIAAVIVMAAPAFAQNAFSDVDEGHWAYDAVNKLAADGLVVGYPDGEFKGKRTLTRYEFAMVINELVPKLMKDVDLSAYATKDDLAGFVKAGDIKSTDISGCATKADLDTISKLANEFKAELTALGTDVNALNAEINALKSRVAAIEDEQARVKINGSLTVASKIDFKKDSAGVVDYDGNFVNEGKQALPFHKDFQIDIKGRVSNNINAYISLVAGDYMKKGVDKSRSAWGTSVSNAGDVSVIPYYMYATVDMNKWGNFAIGRLPFQVNKYVFKKYDTDSYVDINRMDDGNYAVDGVDYTKDFGSIDARVWLVRPQYEMFFDETLVGNYNTAQNVKGILGGQLGFDISTARLEVLGEYVYTTKNALGKYDQSKVYGATLAVPFGDVKLDGAFFEQKTKGTDKARMYDINLGVKANGFSFGGGYRDVQKGYAAPGDWEAMAWIHNPDNIKGFNAYLGYEIGRFDIKGTFKQYKEKDKNFGYIYDNDKIKYIAVNAGYDTGKVGKFNAKYENLKVFGNKFQYITVSWLKEIGNAKIKLGYQNINNKAIDNKGNMIFGQATYNF